MLSVLLFVCAVMGVQGAAVFVAGSAKKMPGDVHKSLSGALQAHAGLTEVESREFLARLAKAKKYVVEAWS
jgi:sulfite reductase alpha subunit-like flavoprotein